MCPTSVRALKKLRAGALPSAVGFARFLLAHRSYSRGAVAKSHSREHALFSVKTDLKQACFTDDFLLEFLVRG